MYSFHCGHTNVLRGKRVSIFYMEGKSPKKMKNIAAVAMAGCMAASLAACGSSAASTDTAASSSAATAESTEATEATGASADGFTVQLGPNPETLDPALNSAIDGANTIITTFEPLLLIDENNEVIPGQADLPEVSEDGLTLSLIHIS